MRKARLIIIIIITIIITFSPLEVWRGITFQPKSEGKKQSPFLFILVKEYHKFI